MSPADQTNAQRADLHEANDGEPIPRGSSAPPYATTSLSRFSRCLRSASLPTSVSARRYDSAASAWRPSRRSSSARATWQQVIAGELAALVELVHQREAALELARHRDGDRAVELDHRRWVHAGRARRTGRRSARQSVAAAVGACACTAAIAACSAYGPGGRPPGAQRGFDQRRALVDLRAVPARPVLLLEQHDVARLVQAGRAPRVVQQHEREQPLRLGVRRQQLDQHAPEPDGLLAQLVPHQPRAEAGGSSPR